MSSRRGWNGHGRKLTRTRSAVALCHKWRLRRIWIRNTTDRVILILQMSCDSLSLHSTPTKPLRHFIIPYATVMHTSPNDSGSRAWNCFQSEWLMYFRPSESIVFSLTNLCEFTLRRVVWIHSLPWVTFFNLGPSNFIGKRSTFERASRLFEALRFPKGDSIPHNPHKSNLITLHVHKCRCSAHTDTTTVGKVADKGSSTCMDTLY